MNREQIIQAITQLSKSQGFYQRLLDMIEEGGTEVDNFLNHMESQNFSDTIDLILYLEQ